MMRTNSFKKLAIFVLSTLPFLSQAAMPGMKGPQHFGFTVPNMDEAVTFYEEVIGCEGFFSIGPFGPFEDDWMTTNLNVNKEAVIKSAYMVRCGNGTNFEIFEYTSPDQNTTYVKNSDYGGNHIAFYVEDIDDAVAYLKKHGVQVLGEPKTFTDTGMEGLSWVYFLAPWGQQLEILSYPNGQGYERETERRLWDPRD
ncbi:VOC family protein [Paraglaciecola mesophila]|nr:VOC family protein [Paraglaciecola mesophila]